MHVRPGIGLVSVLPSDLFDARAWHQPDLECYMETVYETEFLAAAAALVDVQQELMHEFEVELGMSAYDYWIRLRAGRGSVSKQSPRKRSWQYHFHGLEFDAQHDDGRHIRAELGPNGRTEVFTGWSIGVFVVDAKAPWPVFAELRALIQHEPGFPKFEHTSRLAETLLRQGMFEHADPELFALRERYTRRRPDGASIIDIPPALCPLVGDDIFLCERLVLSAAGRRAAKAV
jgi:hypothetical protein